MRKTILTFGLLSAAVATGLMLLMIPFMGSSRVDLADILGYTSMVLAGLLVYFGIRSYRERAAGGSVTFGRAMAVGVLISLVSCVIYMAAFQLVYFVAVPDFGERFVTCMIDRARAAGGTDAEILEATEQAQMFKRLYDHPATNAALTFACSFPIGLIASAVSAAILRKR